MFGPGSNSGAYNSSPMPGNRRQDERLKNYDRVKQAQTEKYRKQGYVVQGDSYFKREPDATAPGGYRLKKVGSLSLPTSTVQTERSSSTAQPPGKGKGMANLGPNYKNDEIAATIVAASHNPLAAGASPEARKILDIPDRAYNGNSVGPQRNAPPPDGGSGSGTQTGFTPIEINLGLAEKSLGRKIADVNNFLSENLPVVGYKDQGGREIRPTGDDLSELQGSYADGLIAKDQLIFEGISTPGKNGVSPADVADNKRSVRIPGDMDDMDPMSEATGGDDDDDFGGPDPEDYATNYSARRTAQRNAFLDPSISNSMDALNASKAEIGLAVRGGKHYANDNGTLREITKAAYDKQSSTGLSADELKGAYVGSVKEKLVPVATAGVFDEDMDLGPISKGVTLNSPVDMGDMSKTEFDFNNITPSFSKPREEMKVNYFAGADIDIDDDED